MGGGGTSLARHDLLSRNQYAAYSREASEAHSEICCIVCILTGGQPFRSGLSRTMNHLLGDRAQTGRSGRSLNLPDRVRTNGNGRFRSLVRDIHHGLCIRCCKKGLQWRLFFSRKLPRSSVQCVIQMLQGPEAYTHGGMADEA